jgi:hypothetical protein
MSGCATSGSAPSLPPSATHPTAPTHTAGPGATGTAITSPWSAPLELNAPTGTDASLTDSLTCPTTTYCMVADQYGYIYQYQTGDWIEGSQISPSIPDREIIALSCATPSFCAAGTNGPDILNDRSGKWTDTPVKGLGQDVGAISCHTTSFCMATGDFDASWIYSKGSWTSGPLVNTHIADGFSVNSLSCAAPGWCVGVSQGYAFTFSNGQWAPPVQLDPNNNFTDDVMADSCPTTNFCLAVGSDGFVDTYQSGRWAPETSLDPLDSLTAVSCATATWCMAVDNHGFTFLFSKGSWSATRVQIADFQDISCPATGYCWALDTSGRVYRYSNLAPTPGLEYTGTGTTSSWCGQYGGVPLAGFEDVFACKVAPDANSKAGETPFEPEFPGFQCVELANRFLSIADDGDTIWDTDVTIGSYLYGGNFAATAGSHDDLTTYTPSPGVLPAQGDIVSMWGGTSKEPEDGSDSHVAIVTAVTKAPGGGWSITTLNENDQSDKTGDGVSSITIDAKWNWSYEGGYFTQFEWVVLPH